jgi:hypothetical protein
LSLKATEREWPPEARPWVNCFQFSFVRLSNEEIEWTRRIGIERNSIAKKSNVKNHKFTDSREDEEINIEGVQTEFGYYRIFDRDPYKGVKLNKTPGDIGWDDEIDGKRIQIKGHNYIGNNQLLICPDDLIDKYDFIVQMRAIGNKIIALGYLSKMQFKKMAKPEPLAKWRKASSVHQSKLNYIFWLPFHAKYGDEWLELWSSRLESASNEHEQERAAALQRFNEEWDKNYPYCDAAHRPVGGVPNNSSGQ